MNAQLARLLALLTSATALACSLVGCASSDSSATDTLTVGFVVDPSWAQVPVAEKAGLFGKHGVKVTVLNFASGVEALQALAAHQVDIATAADVPAAATLARSPSLRVVADGSRWQGSRIVARRDAGITSVDNLAGRSVGTPLGTSAAYFAAKTLTDSGVKANLVQVAPEAMVTAATRHNVDAVSIFQPYQAQVIAALGNDAVALPGGGYVQHSLYLATDTAVARKRPALTGFFAALDEAGTRLTARSPDAVAAVASATQLAPDLLARILPEFDFTLRLQPEVAADLGTLANWAKSDGRLDASTRLPDYASVLDGGFLPRTG